jgi:hypothetical protein
MTSCLSYFKVTPSFFFSNAIPNNVTDRNYYVYISFQILSSISFFFLFRKIVKECIHYYYIPWVPYIQWRVQKNSDFEYPHVGLQYQIHPSGRYNPLLIPIQGKTHRT